MSDEWKVLTIGILLVFSVIYMVVNITVRVESAGLIAGVERVRIDAASVARDNSEDVAGLVIEANMLIRRHQQYNQRWWAAWVIPNSWDAVEFIDVPYAVSGGE